MFRTKTETKLFQSTSNRSWIACLQWKIIKIRQKFSTTNKNSKSYTQRKMLNKIIKLYEYVCMFVYECGMVFVSFVKVFFLYLSFTF